MENTDCSENRPEGAYPAVDFDLNMRLRLRNKETADPDPEAQPITSAPGCDECIGKLKDRISSFLPDLVREKLDSSTDYLLSKIVDGLPSNRYFQLTQTDSVGKLIDAELERTVVSKIVSSESFNRRVEAKVTESAEVEFTKFRSILTWVSSTIAGILVILGGIGYFSLRDMFTEVAKKRDQIEVARQEIDKYRSDVQSQLAEFKGQAGQLTRVSADAKAQIDTTKRDLESTDQLVSQSRGLLFEARQAVATDSKTIFDNIGNIQNQARLAQQANATLVAASADLAKAISNGQMSLDAAVRSAGTTDQQLVAALADAKKTLKELGDPQVIQDLRAATNLANVAAKKATRASAFRTLTLTSALTEKSQIDDPDNPGRHFELVFSLANYKGGRLPLHISVTEIGTPNTTTIDKNLVTDPVFGVSLPGKSSDLLWCEIDAPQKRGFRGASVILRLYAL